MTTRKRVKLNLDYQKKNCFFNNFFKKSTHHTKRLEITVTGLW
jgi:hypothetical protein